jgi:hypothetical protein
MLRCDALNVITEEPGIEGNSLVEGLLVLSDLGSCLISRRVLYCGLFYTPDKWPRYILVLAEYRLGVVSIRDLANLMLADNLGANLGKANSTF